MLPLRSQMLSNKIGKIPYWLIRRVSRAFIVIGHLLMVELQGKMHDYFRAESKFRKMASMWRKTKKSADAFFWKKENFGWQAFPAIISKCPTSLTPPAWGSEPRALLVPASYFFDSSRSREWAQMRASTPTTSQLNLTRVKTGHFSSLVIFSIRGRPEMTSSRAY